MAHHAKGASPEQLETIMELVNLATIEGGRISGIVRLFRAAFVAEDGDHGGDPHEAAEILAERLEDIAERLTALQFNAHVAAGWTKPRSAERVAHHPT